MFRFLKRVIASDQAIPVITGIGIISPIGEGVDTWWKNLCDGKSGIDTIRRFDPSSYPCTSAAEVKNWDPSRYMSTRYTRILSRGAQFALVAFELAKQDAGLEYFEPYGTDIIMGSAGPDLISIEEEVGKGTGFGVEYNADMDPSATLRGLMSTPANLISLQAKTKGYVTTHSSACASGLDALNAGAERIIHKQAHTVIVGGLDTYVNKIVLHAFCFAKAVAFDNGEKAEKALKPFDRERTRSLLGEGACVLILEEKERAKSRQARIYCTLTPGKQNAENNNAAFTHEKSAKTWAQLIKDSVKDQKIDLINAHGPGDKIIDHIEVKAFKQAFGKDLDDVEITSIKSTTGGGSAFASMSQAAATAKTIYENTISPTANYKTPDPELQGISPVVTEKKAIVNKALVNAHAMGGVSTTTILSRLK